MDNSNRYEYSVERPAAAPEAPKKKRRSLPLFIALLLAFTLTVGGAGGLVGYYLNAGTLPAEEPAAEQSYTPPGTSDETPQDTAVPVITQPAATSEGALTVQEIFALGDRSTVAISTTSDSVNVFGQPVSQASAGSGFILTSDGYILTNQHVIENASDVTVLLYDGTEYPAKVVGEDALTDVAVLKIDAKGLAPVKIGNSDKLVVGDQVAAIGNPLGELSNSLTVGYISAKKRVVSIDNTPRMMLQTDASVSPGNSGGPLFNIVGEVVGVVAAKTVASGVEGIGFAIPINLAADIAGELIQNGRIAGRPLLGISYQETVPNAGDSPRGVYVASVSAGTAAETAGLRQGDIITALGGERVVSGSELQIAKNLYRVGDTVSLTVWRDGQEIELFVTFNAEMPEETTPQAPLNPWRR